MAAEYGKLKENILSDIESGKIRRIVDGRPNGYSEAKLKFVEKYSKAAKEEFRNCYSPREIDVYKRQPARYPITANNYLLLIQSLNFVDITFSEICIFLWQDLNCQRNVPLLYQDRQLVYG